MTPLNAKPDHDLSEPELIARAIARNEVAIRVIIKRYNRRLYRIARSVLHDESDTEDAVQEAYIHAFTSLAAFRGEASLGTWLSRIVLNEALQRKRRRAPKTIELKEELDLSEAQIIPFPSASGTNPEQTAAQRQLCRLLEQEIGRLPEEFRIVIVARVIEDMSIAETAELLDLKPETVKTRLHRARHMLKVALAAHIEPLLTDVFPFAGARCERMTESVLERLRERDSR
jgi:RNA polymerase sigma-70 factor, ECF subfamily